MASVDDVKKLASLARLSFDESELEAYAKDFDSIIGYVSKLSELEVQTDATDVPENHNVFREDEHATAGGTNTKAIVEQFPKKDGNYLSVKKIISYD